MDGLFGILKENGEIARGGDLKAAAAAAARRPNATLAVHARVKPGGSVGLGGRGVETFTRSVRCPPSGRGRAGGRAADFTSPRRICQMPTMQKQSIARAHGHHTYASASGMDGG